MAKFGKRHLPSLLLIKHSQESDSKLKSSDVGPIENNLINLASLNLDISIVSEREISIEMCSNFVDFSKNGTKSESRLQLEISRNFKFGGSSKLVTAGEDKLNFSRKGKWEHQFIEGTHELENSRKKTC